MQLLSASLDRAHRNTTMSTLEHNAVIQCITGGVDHATLVARSAGVAEHLTTMHNDLLTYDNAKRHIEEAADYFEKITSENER